MKKYILFTIVLLAAANFSLIADSAHISGIDNASMFINQTVKINVNVSDANGKPILGLNKDDFQIFEKPLGGKESQKTILDFESGANRKNGISILLIMDNSGSMYANDDGTIEDSADSEIWRITHAKNAVLSLLDEIDNPVDKTGLASFNYKLGNLVDPAADTENLKKALEQISKPSQGEGYTELYECLNQSINIVKNIEGRKIIILLSDGENYPLKDNPEYPVRVEEEGAIERAVKEGVTVFTIGFGLEADEASLKRISEETGGLFFKAANQRDLEEMYSLIREQVLNEYNITYKAGMEASPKKEIRVAAAVNGTKLEDSRSYFSDTMFGSSGESFNLWLLLIPPFCIAIAWALTLFKFEQKKSAPSLDILSRNGKKPRRKETTIIEDLDEIKIGTGKNADVTVIANGPGITEARIKKDQGGYTIIGDGAGVTVNNRKVKSKELRAGDLIGVGNSTIIFDPGEIARAKR